MACEELRAYRHIFLLSSRVCLTRSSALCCHQFEWLTVLPSPTRGFGRLHALRLSLERKVPTRCGPHWLAEVRRRLILAADRLRALLAQEAEVEQTKAQEVTLKDAIECPSAGDGQKEKERRALVKAREIPMPIPSPTASEVQGTRKAAKTINAPILLCVTHSTPTIAR